MLFVAAAVDDSSAVVVSWTICRTLTTIYCGQRLFAATVYDYFFEFSYCLSGHHSLLLASTVTATSTATTGHVLTLPAPVYVDRALAGSVPAAAVCHGGSMPPWPPRRSWLLILHPPHCTATVLCSPICILHFILA